MLEGDLTDFTLPDILQLLAFTSKSGRLTLHGTDAVGRIDLEGGQLRDASSDATRLRLARRLLGAGIVRGEALQAVLRDRSVLPTDLELADALAGTEAIDRAALPDLVREQAVDAVFDLLRWDRGSFRFDLHAGPQLAGSMEAAWTTEEILTEAQQRLDDWSRVRDDTGTGDAVVVIARPTASAETVVTPDGWSLLALIDGRRTVNELISLSGQGEFRTRSVLAGLVDAGVAAVKSPDEAPTDLLAEHAALAAVEEALEAPISQRPHGEATAPAPTEVEATPAGRDEDTPTAAEDEATKEAVTDAEAPGEVTPLRRDARRTERLRTDPTVDAELIERLIDGVESL